MQKKIDKYLIKEIIGQGGMGCVYKAFDPNIEKFLALKVILPDQEQEIERFFIEAKAMAKINHPNIVKIYNIGVDHGQPFLVMDYIQGVSLKEYLKKTSLNIRSFCQLMIKIGEAIYYVHKQGIIHRDLKPSNIMIDQYGQPQVVDFGLAKVNFVDKSISKSGVILGTPSYMSPEQAEGEKVDHLTDVYALGAIFYEMLAQKPLIKGDTVIEIIFKVLHNEPKRLRLVNKKLSKDLETICAKAIEKEKIKRYQSAKEFAQEIKRFLNGEIIKAKPSGLFERIWKKHKTIITTTTIGISLLILSLFIVKVYQARSVDSQVEIYISKAYKLEQEAKFTKQKIKLYMEASDYLEKALEIANQNQIRKKLFQLQYLIAARAKKQKNYLLSFQALRKCQRLGDLKAREQLKLLEKYKNKLREKHKEFIDKAMQVLQNQPQEQLINWYTFKIIKIGQSYLVEMLQPYLQSHYKWQRILAIKALGRLGNNLTKVKGKNSVWWLMESINKFKDKESIVKNEKEVEELIWALGWLKDSRANKVVHDIRWLAGENGLLWNKTRIAYKWIPLPKTLSKDAYTLNLRGIMKHGKGDYLGAIADYTQAIKINPKFLDAYNSRGISYLALKEYAKAITDYTQAIKINPKFLTAYSNRGNVYLVLKEYPKAIVDYSRALKIAPNLFAYNNRALAYEKLKDFSKAIADYTRALKVNPHFAEAYYGRGGVYRERKEYAKAIANYNQAIKINPKLAEAYCGRGNAYQAIKEYSKSIVDYSQALKINPKLAKVYHERGNAYQAIKEYAKSIADYNQAIRINPKSSIFYNHKGNTYHYLKKYHKAIINYSQAIKVNPRFLLAYCNRGTVYKKLKQYGKAIADYNRALNLDPKDALTYYNRALVYLTLREYQKTYSDFQMFLKLTPHSPAVAHIYAWIKKSKKRGLIK